MPHEVLDATNGLLRRLILGGIAMFQLRPEVLDRQAITGSHDAEHVVLLRDDVITSDAPSPLLRLAVVRPLEQLTSPHLGPIACITIRVLRLVK